MASSSSSKHFYDRQAAGYDRRWAHYQRTTHDMLLAHLHGPFHHVLDVGCGTGTLLQRLLTRYPEADGLGIEASREMLCVARRRLAGRGVRLLLANAHRIPLPARSVDLLTLASVLHYFSSPSMALVEARRVLQSGGTLGLVDYVLHGGANSVLDGLIRLYDPAHARCRGLQELSRLTTHAGFTIIHARQFPIDRIFEGVVILARAPIPGENEIQP
ncbi:MAG TPA: class I SAM-dependent methyltransferase [Chloroflexota bacterium]|nr:class I SAM-dependent methyltransferase [Chloroflexota bacterium]